MDITPSTSRGPPMAKVTSLNSSKSFSAVVEDEVDQLLWKLDGKIQRKRDDKL